MQPIIVTIVLGALLQAGSCAAAAPSAADAMAGVWKIDPASTPTGPRDASGSGDARSDPDQKGGGGGRHGSSGGGGNGGMHGGRGGHHGNHSGAAAAPPSAHGDAAEHELGLIRVYAQQVTITPLPRRIRFATGDHAVELDRDGTSVSGPGVGGTVALTVTGKDFIVDTLTDSGCTVHERYQPGDDGRHLDLQASLKCAGAAQATQFVRVFDRVQAPAVQKTAAAVPPAR